MLIATSDLSDVRGRGGKMRYAHDGTYGPDEEDLMKFDQAQDGWMDLEEPGSMHASADDTMGDTTDQPTWLVFMLPALAIMGAIMVARSIKEAESKRD